MQTNHLFSFQRFVLLCKQSLIINKKLIGLTFIGYISTLFIVSFLFQSMCEFRNWDNNNYEMMLVTLFSVWGIIYASHSFTGFRSKEKSISYLMLPATNAEKYIFEFVTRIVLFVVMMPLLFWITVNLEGAIAHHFIPEFANYKFSFLNPELTSKNPVQNEGWISLAIVQGILFVFITAFTGASYFTKSPLLKISFTVTLIASGYSILVFILVKGLNINKFHHENSMFLMNHGRLSIALLGMGIIIVNVCLLAIAWFSLKEKEV